MNDSREHKKPLVITIDGPSGSGKSTIAAQIAERLDLPCLNSGAIYRTVTLAVMEAGGCFDDSEEVRRIVEKMTLRTEEKDGRTCFYLDGRDVTTRIKDPDVTTEIWRVANKPEYRKLLVSLQRQSVGERGLVAEGRDMGTVIFPDANAKVFLDAPLEVRARRQHDELLARGVDSSFEEVLEKSRIRDEHDTSRASAPLRAASDALSVDSGGLTADEVVDKVLAWIQSRSWSDASDSSGGQRSDELSS